jgi:CRISPR-associated protein Cmr2
VRPFGQTAQQGWRDSLSGEAEWLCTDRDQLRLPPGQRRDTLWSRVAAARPAWARKGEHLSALNTLKRLWPNLFVRELRGTLDGDITRFVVSTHTMALATSLARALAKGKEVPPALADQVQASSAEGVALPRKLAIDIEAHPDRETLARLPGWLESMKESGDEIQARNADGLMKQFLGHMPEAYYSLLLMDGDRMGAWLSAHRACTLTHEKTFHPQVRTGLAQLRDDRNFLRYAKELRAPSPSRHMAISEALNHFALTLATIHVT